MEVSSAMHNHDVTVWSVIILSKSSKKVQGLHASKNFSEGRGAFSMFIQTSWWEKCQIAPTPPSQSDSICTAVVLQKERCLCATWNNARYPQLHSFHELYQRLEFSPLDHLAGNEDVNYSKTQTFQKATSFKLTLFILSARCVLLDPTVSSSAVNVSANCEARGRTSLRKFVN